MTDVLSGAWHQHVLCRIGDHSASFGLHGVNQTIGRRDKTVVVEVIAAGPGNVSRGTRNECTLRPGQLALVNLFHRTHEIVVLGQNLSTFNWENMMATIDVNEELKTVDMLPLQGFIVTRTNERRAQYVMMGKSGILNPSGDAQLSGGGAFDFKGKRVEQIKIACEEVVHVGPGAVLDGLWQEPKCATGDMILYDTSTTPVTFTAAGKSYTLVNWRNVILSFRDGQEPRVSAPAAGS